MFYALSKALLFLIMPLTWVTLLVIISFMQRSRSRRLRTRLMAGLICLIFGNEVVFDSVIQQWEYPTSIEEPKHHTYAVLLGGYGETSLRTQGIEFNKAADRWIYAVELHQRGVIDTLVISSGVSSEVDSTHTEADASAWMMRSLAIPVDKVIIEDRSWNTYQNAFYTAERIAPNDPIILITSAFHMRRARACFEKQGFKVMPYPVDFYSDSRDHNLSAYILPSFKVMLDWQVLLKEWMGIAVYRLKGYI